MDVHALVPPSHRDERLFLLELLAGRASSDVPGALLEVTPPALYPVLHASGMAFPQAIRETLDAHARSAAVAYFKRIAELRRIDSTLRTGGIELLILKGPVLAATVYPQPASRTMSDLDLVVRAGDVDRAMSALEGAGYRVPSQFVGGALEPGDAPPLMHSDPGSTLIEIHTLLDSSPDDPDAVERAFAGARRIEVARGLSVATLERGEFFAHVVLHVSRHHLFQNQLRSLLDVALLLRAEAAVLDWETLLQQWTKRGIADWIALTLHLAHHLLGAPLPAVFADRPPTDEALSIAAEQLWADPDDHPPIRVTVALAGFKPSPFHEHLAPHAVHFSRWARARSALQRIWKRLARVAASVARGTMRRRNVAESVDLYFKREKLFTMMERRRAAGAHTEPWWRPTGNP
jgi:hypothetical protein